MKEIDQVFNDAFIEIALNGSSEIATIPANVYNRLKKLEENVKQEIKNMEYYLTDSKFCLSEKTTNEYQYLLKKLKSLSE